MNTDRFKFRVWDNHCKRYGLPPYIRRSREDYHIYDVETPQENQELVQHHFVLEQCTGLKDKNGKLIFEGDIVRLSIDGSDKVDREVHYCEYNCKWFMRFCCSFDWGKEYQYYDFNAEKARDLKIIGNIHEMEVQCEEK